ncbi:flagellar export chaperone FliS [Defluviitalea phaphyphila]|uniref:flagellar export chaperone FliS n=1 Tax=Defluviitalea phaphyphila TaxID=1473580 RepID=UPI00073110B4|nr:flagellar export chaperone FliS [Defluviitalea phaphyphila]
MVTNNRYEQYKTNAIMTASPQELTLMLYNGALKFCKQAIEAIKNKNISKAHEYIIRVEDIIQELMITLDKKYPISKDFELLYDYIYRRLVEANVSKNIEVLEEVYGLIKEFRDTWKEAMKKAKMHLPQDVINK